MAIDEALGALAGPKVPVRPALELAAPLIALSGVAGVFALLNAFLVILSR
jgi:hypothetical protein